MTLNTIIARNQIRHFLEDNKELTTNSHKHNIEERKRIIEKQNTEN